MSDLTPAEQAARDQALADLDDLSNLRYPWATYSVHYFGPERGYVVIRQSTDILEEFQSYEQAMAYATTFAEAQQ